MKKLLLQSSISAAFLSLSAVAAADNCASASAFVSGSAYNTGDVVIADGKAYQCQIAGWCQSTADLYYKPGSGFNWSDAWQEKSCDSTASSSTDESTTADNVVDNSINNATDITDTVSDELDESVTIVEEGASQILTDNKHLKLDMSQSHLRFVTVKKENVAEVQRFESMSGVLSADGQLTFSIDLASVNTQIGIRDSRLQEYLFESSLMPKMHFTSHLNMSVIDALEEGQVFRANVDGEIELHGEKKSVNADISIVKIGESINVFSNQAMLINSADFSLHGGIELLRQIASLSSIGETVPVYFDLTFAVEQLQAPERTLAPAAPSNLMSSWSAMGNLVSLSWNDNADNETGYVVQRREGEGHWRSVQGLAENSTVYSESYDQAEVLQYRLFAMNGSVSSGMSNVAKINTALYLDDQTGTADSSDNNGDTADPVNGANLYAENSCTGCHGDDGQSPISLFNNVLPQAELSAYIETQMPYGDAASCEGSCADDIASYIIKNIY